MKILIMRSLEGVHHLRVVISSIFLTIIINTINIIPNSIFIKHLIMPFKLCNIFLPTGFNRRYFITMIILIVLLLCKVLFLVHHIVVIFIDDVLVLDFKVVMLVLLFLLLMLMLLLMLLLVFLLLLVPANGLPVWL